MTKVRLTDLQIKKLEPPERGQKTYFDETLPGFGIRVSQAGSKSWVIVYGKSRRLKTLGRYPDLGLSNARKVAKRQQAELSLLDLNTPRPQKIAFNTARERFLAETATRTKASTTEGYRRLLYVHFNFEKDLTNITRFDIMAVIERLKDTPSERQHAFVAIRTMMNWCYKHGLIGNSPVPPFKFTSVPRSRILSDDELGIVWRRAEAVGHPYGTIVKLLILTGQRRGEIAGLKWSWINDDEIVYPVGFTKNNREHRVPISSMTSALLATISRQYARKEKSSLVFPARGKLAVPVSGWSMFKKSFDKPIEVSDYTLHDLRRTYSSNLARLGVPIHVTEKLLNHVSGSISGVAAIYNRHTYVEEMRKVVEQYEEFLFGVLSRADNHSNPIAYDRSKA